MRKLFQEYKLYHGFTQAVINTISRGYGERGKDFRLSTGWLFLFCQKASTSRIGLSHDISHQHRSFNISGERQEYFYRWAGEGDGVGKPEVGADESNGPCSWRPAALGHRTAPASYMRETRRRGWFRMMAVLACTLASFALGDLRRQSISGNDRVLLLGRGAGEHGSVKSQMSDDGGNAALNSRDICEDGFSTSQSHQSRSELPKTSAGELSESDSVSAIDDPNSDAEARTDGIIDREISVNTLARDQYSDIVPGASGLDKEDYMASDVIEPRTEVGDDIPRTNEQ
eukprot:jgi/Bigna1/77834/fgenesh1_pg.50_\